MGLLDNLGGGIVKNMMEGQGLDLQSIAQTALKDVGGLNAIVAQLQNAGLGDQVASWLGNGENQSVSDEQIQSALNPDQLTKIAGALGINLGDVSSLLAEHLPNVVDKASPNGELES